MIIKSIVIKSIIWKLLERFSVQAIIFAVTIVLARLVPPSDYGLIAIVLVFIGIANVIVDGGLNSALIQKKNADQIDFSTIFYVNLIFAAILIFILWISAPYIAIFYENKQLIKIIRVLSLSLVFFAVNSIQKAYISKKLLFKKLFICSLFPALITGFVCILMAKKGYGVWALVTQNILSQFITTVVMFWTVKWYPSWKFSIERFKKLFDFGWKIFVSNFIISLFNNIRSLIIGKVYTPSALAFFDRGRQFPILIIDNINASVQAVLFPVFSNNQDNRDLIINLVRRAVKLNAYIIFPIMTGLIVLAKPLIIILLTDRWVPAIPYVQILGIASMLLPIQISNLEAIKSLGYSNITLKLEMIKKILELIILVITVPMGVKAIAWGIVAYNAICVVINLHPSKVLLKYSVLSQVKDVIPSLFLSGLMALCVCSVYLFLNSAILQLVIGTLIGILSYIGISILFKNDSYRYLWAKFKNK